MCVVCTIDDLEGAMASLAVRSRVYACGAWWLMLSLERGVAVNSAVDGKIGKVWGGAESMCSTSWCQSLSVICEEFTCAVETAFRVLQTEKL